ncbi:hypothetical protein E3N88_10408 [Mikania micrantha]|uniref:Uncharacterized protein n=1 Tax=Mikania micrantha TaxID=192012 RepID=A0A5N6PCT0_9ASTR|nr:hypothetical protein E3N88_10408 [Mikania micrantha]
MLAHNINGTAGFSEEESHSVCTFMKLAFDLEKSECQDNFQVILLVYSYIYTVVAEGGREGQEGKEQKEQCDKSWVKCYRCEEFGQVSVIVVVVQMVNAAVIVDPSTNKVIASACDQVRDGTCSSKNKASILRIPKSKRGCTWKCPQFTR